MLLLLLLPAAVALSFERKETSRRPPLDRTEESEPGVRNEDEKVGERKIQWIRRRSPPGPRASLWRRNRPRPWLSLGTCYSSSPLGSESTSRWSPRGEKEASGPTDFDRGERTFEISFPRRCSRELFPPKSRKYNTHRAVPCVWMLVTSGFLETRLIKVSFCLIENGRSIEWSKVLFSRQTVSSEPGRDQHLLGETRKFEPRLSESDAP